MAAKGEVRVLSYVFPGDVRGIRSAARGAGGRVDKVTPREIPGQPKTIEVVTVLPQDGGFTRFQTLVEADSREARARRGRTAALSPRRPIQRAA